MYEVLVTEIGDVIPVQKRQSVGAPAGAGPICFYGRAQTTAWFGAVRASLPRWWGGVDWPVVTAELHAIRTSRGTCFKKTSQDNGMRDVITRNPRRTRHSLGRRYEPRKINVWSERL